MKHSCEHCCFYPIRHQHEPTHEWRQVDDIIIAHIYPFGDAPLGWSTCQLLCTCRTRSWSYFWIQYSLHSHACEHWSFLHYRTQTPAVLMATIWCPYWRLCWHYCSILRDIFCSYLQITSYLDCSILLVANELYQTWWKLPLLLPPMGMLKEAILSCLKLVLVVKSVCLMASYTENLVSFTMSSSRAIISNKIFSSMMGNWIVVVVLLHSTGKHCQCKIVRRVQKEQDVCQSPQLCTIPQSEQMTMNQKLPLSRLLVMVLKFVGAL